MRGREEKRTILICREHQHLGDNQGSKSLEETKAIVSEVKEIEKCFFVLVALETLLP